ncbi:crossover junction endonuclease EME1 isoform X2 [Polyodon spathula]|nr:crossover junction endonuclease EME1 isoform X2 [Polyodon spathula]XP_041076607.1 crossover junction endonuclease EME1 isoform X2 [Polyodon spathula]XP_041076608.1 crossover junction endonuclease EME1 isoform X2 [Polyodon spathula]XP_041076609.1 crossover junction endonuclease EME1 isoform X2 [Polyodon spathula]
MISSESEEEVFVPLSERLKGRIGDCHETKGTGTLQPMELSNPYPAGSLENVVPLRKSVSSAFTSQPVLGLKGAIEVWDFSDSEEENEALNSRGPCFYKSATARPVYPEEHGLPVMAVVTSELTPLKRKPVKRSKAQVEQARLEALRKRTEKDKQRAERENHKQELEQERAKKKCMADAVKALRPEECLKYLVATIDPALLQVEGGGQLLTMLQALGCSCAIESQAVPHSVTWRRRVTLTQGEEAVCVPEPHAVIYVPMEDFVYMVHSYKQEQQGCASNSIPSLISWTRGILGMSAGRTPALAVVNMEKYFRSQKSQNQKKHRQAVLGEGDGINKRKKRREGELLPDVSRVDLEEALVDLQLHTEVQVRFLETWKEFSDYIAMVTKAVAEAPFKHERNQAGFSFYLESEWSGGCKVDRSGKGLIQVWKRQIQQFNRVSPEIASAILAAYPSPQLLVRAYRKCSSDQERHTLLADILVRRGEGVTSTSRRVGPELSKRIYLLVTSLDPELSLEATG